MDLQVNYESLKLIRYLNKIQRVYHSLTNLMNISNNNIKINQNTYPHYSLTKYLQWIKKAKQKSLAGRSC